MTWTYCEQWNNLLESPMEPLTVEEARARHADGQLYTATPVSDGTHPPKLRVEIRWETEYAGVTYMDDYGRDKLHYSFSVINDSLFLDTVISYSYGNSEVRGGYADAEYMETYDFTPDGITHRTIDSEGEKSRESREIDISLNWEKIPEFGDYASLIRRDRDKPPAN